MGDAASQCTSCNSGFYLAPLTHQLGECLQKTTTPPAPASLYVSNLASLLTDGKSTQERTGHQLNPFINL